MLVRNQESMEKGMSITYSDIRSQHKLLQEKYKARKELLQSDAQDLMKEYYESLDLPASSWKDKEGVEQPYVRSCIINQQGDLEYRPAHVVQLDEDYRLNFQMGTMVNDTLCVGDWYYVAISLWYENSLLHVSVANGAHEFTIPKGTVTDRFFEVTSAIKTVIHTGLDDPELD
ncbi:hypothetical protein LGZ99_23575 [Photorhabdus temperata]|uniref:Uncharacterized protein n=2 Tax=Photorhabdus cinerea TaxID=471575 RepID=A0A7X5QIB8_9GAMM|nr:hypothetical protein [Photorhabdus temperata]MCT8350091.1 hypothetical protein [Photorhabdus temperata]NHB94857.1 hypothetical protein [Photorhabdus cinerea]